MKKIHVRVFRFDPESDEKPHYQNYVVDVNDGARVLHVLQAIHDDIDPTLSFRYCCSAGQCGSCAVRVNGVPVLACMEEAIDGMTVEPLDLPVKKDLVVDLSTFLETLPAIQPCGEPIVPDREKTELIKPCEAASSASAASRSARRWMSPSSTALRQCARNSG